MKKKSKKLVYPLVLIEWEDSVLGYQGWKFIADNMNQCTRFLSVGFLVYKDKNKVILYPHIKDEQTDISGSGDIVIPTSVILKTTVLG